MVSSGVYLIAFALCFNVAFGLRCYSCDSSKSMTCSFGLLSAFIDTVDCNQVVQGESGGFLNTIGSYMPTECMKLVGVDRSGNNYIARGCTLGTGGVNTCQMMAQAIRFADSKEIEKLDCWTCNTDQCNSATTISSIGIFAGVVAACLAFLF